MLPIATLLSARRRGPHFVVPRRLHLVIIPDHFCFPEGELPPSPGFTNTIPHHVDASGLYPVGLW